MITADWIVDTVFSAANVPLSDRNIYLLSADGLDKGEGCLFAFDVNNDMIFDSLWVIITPPSAQMLGSPCTRDSDGDGWLDRIDLFLDRTVSLPDSGITAVVQAAHGFSCVVDSITTLYDSILMASVVSVHLAEDSSEGIPQTGWLPKLQLAGIPFMTAVDAYCVDSAGPVLYTITKTLTIDNRDYPSEQEISVVFSEPVVYKSAPLATSGIGPDSTLNAWTSGGGASWNSLPDFFAGSFAFRGYDRNYTFTMPSDSIGLESTNWVNLLTTGLSDINGNAPVAGNRRVKVTIDGDDSMSIRIR